VKLFHPRRVIWRERIVVLAAGRKHVDGAGSHAFGVPGRVCVCARVCACVRVIVSTWTQRRESDSLKHMLGVAITRITV
jgi:hypothetical protein